MNSSGSEGAEILGSEVTVEPIAVDAADDHWTGEVATASRPVDLAAAVARLVDPGAATQTIHWGRNYLYRTRIEVYGPTGEPTALDVVVKQFRNQGSGKQLERKVRGSKAWRSWRMAKLFAGRGIPTADPVLWIESSRPDGPSYFVCRHLADRIEARYLFRAVNDEDPEETFPGFDFDAFLVALAGALRTMHDRGLFHRDLSIGNVLVPKAATEPTKGGGAPPLRAEDLDLIDLNRARDVGEPGTWRRTRDFGRLPLFRPEHRERFLRAYWRSDGGPGLWQRLAYRLAHHGFYLKIGLKKKVRAPFRGLAAWLRPRRAHVHIPEAPTGAGARDKIVWDHLSDQPHQHAGRFDKLKVRLADAPAHLRHHAIFAAAVPRIWRRYRRLQREFYARPVPWDGVGVCVRPPEQESQEGDLLRLVDDLGVHHVLLRLHPWQEEHDAEERLAAELVRRGYELAFSLPQNRDLVRDPALWRRRVEHLADRFVPYGRHFQVGQAINRSKWGVWVYGEYVDLARSACEVLRRHEGVEVLGPAVIDFELNATASVLNLPECPRFDAVASLLYVDRRGAPENPQLGFDTVGKVLLTQAIADTARAAEGRSWITEVNWPLWEGPHSPAGKSVSVDEASHADYLARYYLLALTTGCCERVYWWQMVARGYGLVAPGDDAPDQDLGTWRRRPAFHALRTLDRQLRGRTFLGPLPGDDPARGVRLFRFGGGSQDPEGDESTELLTKGGLVVGWCTGETTSISLPFTPSSIVEQDGGIAPGAADGRAELRGSVRYFHV